MDSGISDMINNVLSNPDALNKIMTLMPAVTQMMNSGGTNNVNQEKIVETTAVNKPADVSTENIMANAEVMNAFKNLINVMNTASPNVPTENITENISENNNENNTGAIEKTLDTLKNFTSATSPESDHRLKLLIALKPFLKDGRKAKIDAAVKYMNAAKIINIFGKNGFV